MIRRLAFAAPLLLTAAGPAAPDPVAALAGRYYHQFPDGLVDGTRYTGQDVVEIVAVAPGAAYVRVHLDFYNGHECDVSGVAIAKQGALVYHDPEPSHLADDPGCTLTLRHAGKDLRIDDGEGSCHAWCGARGSLSDAKLPFASRRPIRYLAKLKASKEYRDALAAWRKPR